MEKFSYHVNRFTHYFSCIALVALMFLITLEVGGRYLFNKPIRGTYELTELTMVVIVFLALGYAQHHKEHITIDLFYELMPKSMQKIVYRVTTLLFLIVVSMIAWRLSVFSGRMMTGGYQSGVLQIPIQPAVLLAFFGTLCFALAIFVTLISSNKKEEEE